MDKDKNGKAILGIQGYKSPVFQDILLEKSLKIRNLLKIVASEFYGAITESIIKRKWLIR